MNYEALLESVKEVSKESLKKMVFELDQKHSDRIKEMNIDAETKRELLIMLKDRSFFEMLLVNGLKESEE